MPIPSAAASPIPQQAAHPGATVPKKIPTFARPETFVVLLMVKLYCMRAKRRPMSVPVMMSESKVLGKRREGNPLMSVRAYILVAPSAASFPNVQILLILVISALRR